MFSSFRMKALVAGIAISLMCGIMYAWSVFVLPLEQQFGWSRQALSATFTFLMAFFSMGMIMGGWIMRHTAPRISVWLGCVLFGCGMWLASSADKLWLLYLGYGVLGGFGIGLINIVPTSVCMSHFPEKKGLVGGVITMALSVGTLLLGSICTPVLISFTGVQTTLRVIAILVPVVAFPAAFFMIMPTASGETRTVDGNTFKEAVHMRSYWHMWIWLFLMQTCGLMAIGHLVPFATGAGCSAVAASALLAVYSISNGLGRPIFGFFYDKLGRGFSLPLTALFLAGGMSLLSFKPEYLGSAGIFIGAVLAGLAHGGSVPQAAALCMSFFGRRFFPLIYGSSTIATMCSGIIGPLTGGFLFAFTGSYALAFGVALGVALCGFVPSFLLWKDKNYDEK